MATDFVIAEGVVVIETQIDGDKITRTARVAGQKAGDEAGRHFFRRFVKMSAPTNQDRKSWFKRTFQHGLFKNDPELMRGLLHPIESFFSRPIAAMFGTTLLPFLVGALTAAVSSAVLLTIGGGILAGGAAILLGNESFTKKLAKDNATKVRASAATEMGLLRAHLRQRLAAMKANGASEEEIAKVRTAGNLEIANAQLRNQKRIADAAKATNTSLLDAVKTGAQKALNIMTQAAQPLIKPFLKAGGVILKFLERMEPQFERLFVAAAPIIPLLVDSFIKLAEIILPQIETMMPAIVGMFEVLAQHAPDLAEAIVTLLIAMSDKEAVTAFGIILTGIAGSFVILAQVIAVFNRAFILTARIWEAEIHFFRKVPGYLKAAWGNMVQWFHTGVDAVVGAFITVKNKLGDIVDSIAGFFSGLEDQAGESVDATAGFFRELPGKILRWLKGLPKALAHAFEMALEGALMAVGFGLGAIVEYFVRLPGRIIGPIDRLWDLVVKAVGIGITKTVTFFATLPARVTSWVTKTWESVLETTERWFVKIVAFVALLPGRIQKWIVKTWQTTLATTKNWFTTIVKFIGGLPDRAATALVNLAIRINKRFTESWDKAKKTSTSKIFEIAKIVLGVPVLLWQKLIQLKNKLVDRFAQGWSAATGTQKTKVVAIINHILGIPGRAFNALRALAGQLKSRASAAWQAFRDEAGRKVTNFITFVQGIPGRVVRGLGNMALKLRASGRELIGGLLEGVREKIRIIGGLGSWFKKNLVDPIVTGVKRFFHITSPSKVFQGIGQMLVAGLWKGVTSSNPTKVITKIFGSMPKALMKMVELGLISIGSLPQKVLKSLFGIFDDLFGGGGGGGAGGLVGFARAAWDIFQNAFHLPMGGWRATGSVPGSDHPKGKAIDIMTLNAMVHQLIIAMGKQLPGAKYWISMRRIASAPDWIPRPYSGPSPHTDHVHWSFYRQGGRLPEDVFGFGRRGMYQFHKGEDVLRRNQTSIGHQGNIIHVTNNVTVSASNIKELNQVVDLMKGLQVNARMTGLRPRTV